MECRKWHEKTIGLIRSGKWSELHPYHARWSCEETCGVCDFAFYIELVFIEAGVFTPDALSAARVLCGYIEPHWFSAVTVCAPPVDTLRAMVEAGLFGVNQVGTCSLIELYLDIRPPWWREAIDYLLSQGASIDVQNNFRRTPLLSVIMYLEDKEEAVRFLLERGADKNLEDHYGFSPMSYTDRPELLMLLQ